jgi:hypothetical protein
MKQIKHVGRYFDLQWHADIVLDNFSGLLSAMTIFSESYKIRLRYRLTNQNICKKCDQVSILYNILKYYTSALRTDYTRLQSSPMAARSQVKHSVPGGASARIKQLSWKPDRKDRVFSRWIAATERAPSFSDLLSLSVGAAD